MKLHTRDGATHQHRALLGALDETLDPRRFVRIHRSAIVNIDVVAELRQDAHADYVAVLRIGRRSASADASARGCRHVSASSCERYGISFTKMFRNCTSAGMPL